MSVFQNCKILTDSCYRNASEGEKLLELNSLSCERISINYMGRTAGNWTGEI